MKYKMNYLIFRINNQAVINILTQPNIFAFYCWYHLDKKKQQISIEFHIEVEFSIKF